MRALDTFIVQHFQAPNHPAVLDCGPRDWNFGGARTPLAGIDTTLTTGNPAADRPRTFRGLPVETGECYLAVDRGFLTRAGAVGAGDRLVQEASCYGQLHFAHHRALHLWLGSTWGAFRPHRLALTQGRQAIADLGYRHGIAQEEVWEAAWYPAREAPTANWLARVRCRGRVQTIVYLDPACREWLVDARLIPDNADIRGGFGAVRGAVLGARRPIRTTADRTAVLGFLQAARAPGTDAYNRLLGYATGEAKFRWSTWSLAAADRWVRAQMPDLVEEALTAVDHLAVTPLGTGEPDPYFHAADVAWVAMKASVDMLWG